MHFLSMQDVLDIHDAVLAAYGGMAGILKHNELDAAVHSPRATWEGQLLYEDEIGVAVAYLYLALSHPFVEGNKRTAWVMARQFLRMNGIRIRVPTEDAVAVMLLISEGKEKDWRVVADWLRDFVVE